MGAVKGCVQDLRLMNTSILATKVGMTQVYDADGVIRPVTVLQVGPCVAGLQRTRQRDGYVALQVVLKRGDDIVAVRESAIEGDSVSCALGDPVSASFIEVGGYVDVIGVSKGRGTSGVMRRHNFHGQRATHGVKKVHRHPGSTGQSTHPSRVFKGAKMAGRYGNARITVRNLRVVQFESESGLLSICGSVPGPNGGLVSVRKPVEL